jgi:hypothetical protein
MCPPRLTISLLAVFLVGWCRGAVLEGLVLEQHTGIPLKQVSVELIGVSRKAVTDEAGRFRLLAMTPGAYRLALSHDGYASLAVMGVIDTNVKLVARMPKAGAIFGHVMNAQGQPERSAQVIPLRLRGSAGVLEPYRQYAGHTDDRGRFRLFGLPPGEYRLAASAPHTAAEVPEEVFRIVSGDELGPVGISLRPQRPRAVSGRVEVPDNAKPFRLRLSPTAAPYMTTSEAQAERDGGFRFASVPPGLYRLLGLGPSMGNSAFGGILGPVPLYASNGAGLDVVDDDVSIDNLVAAPGHAVSFVLESDCSPSGTLHLRAEEDWGLKSRVSVVITASAPLMMADLPPSRYFISMSGLQAGCFLADDPTLDLANSPTDQLRLRTAKAAELRGELIGQRKEAAAIVVLWPETPQGEDAGVVNLIPDANGSFFHDALRPGRYRVLLVPKPSWEVGPWMPDSPSAVEIQLLAGAVTHLELP